MMTDLDHVSLADIGPNDREVLVKLADHVHFVGYVRGRNVARRNRHLTGFTLKRLERLYALGLVKLGVVEGRSAVVLSRHGAELAGEARRRRRRRRLYAETRSPWWLK
jgi:hypothetical protein